MASIASYRCADPDGMMPFRVSWCTSREAQRGEPDERAHRDVDHRSIDPCCTKSRRIKQWVTGGHAHRPASARPPERKRQHRARKAGSTSCVVQLAVFPSAPRHVLVCVNERLERNLGPRTEGCLIKYLRYWDMFTRYAIRHTQYVGATQRPRPTQ